MDFYNLAFPTNLVYFSLTILFFYLSYMYISNSGKKCIDGKKSVPVASGALPILGHLHLFVGSQLPHEIFGNQADKHGPIFSVKLGGNKHMVVVSSWEMAKECLTTNDKVLRSRPLTTASEHIGYNHAVFAFSPYGPYWRRMRKITTSEFLSHHSIQRLKHIPVSDVKSSMKQIYERWTSSSSTSPSCGDKKVAVEMREWFGDITMNSIFKMVVGTRLANNSEWHKTMKEVSCLVEMSTLHIGLPFVKWLDLGGYQKAMRKICKNMDFMLEKYLQEHKRNKMVGDRQKDFMGTIMAILDDDGERRDDLRDYDVDTIVKATCLALLLAGTDTTEVTMVWAVCLLLNNPRTLNKLQEELDTEIGKTRRVDQSDITKLVYLQAIIKETLRLYPPATISPVRQSLSECIIGGYHVPKDTMLILNIHKIQRDPRVWDDPEVFRPERFLTGPQKNVDLKGQSFELIPFSSGGRMCPAVNFALQVMSFTLATFFHGFDISGLVEGEPIDMKECFGLTNHKASPLNVLLSPRLASDLYDM